MEMKIDDMMMIIIIMETKMKMMTRVEKEGVREGERGRQRREREGKKRRDGEAKHRHGPQTLMLLREPLGTSRQRTPHPSGPSASNAVCHGSRTRPRAAARHSKNSMLPSHEPLAQLSNVLHCPINATTHGAKIANT